MPQKRKKRQWINAGTVPSRGGPPSSELGIRTMPTLVQAGL